ncbi:MAG: hypothetical protein IKA55_00935 [Akkermansia sp.]|nr:hypothetical protein [Akkermansia sp.]
MLKNLLTRFRNSGQMNRGDHLLLRWAGLSLSVLVLTVLLTALGVMEHLELEQIRFLGGSPFYIGAEEAQISLLGPAGTFALCMAVTFYLALVLLRERRFTGRLQVAILATTALALPGILCVLWGGVLNMNAPVICSMACWFGAEILHLFRRRS